MVILGALLLFGWGALSAGFGVYALMAAFESESLFHAVQAGISLLIATVSFSAGFVVVILGAMKNLLLVRALPEGVAASHEKTATSPGEGTESHGQRE